MEDRISFAPVGHTLLRRVGKGASSVVWEARGPDGDPVALKILEAADPDALRFFERERQAMEALVLHRNILTILAADVQDGRPWLVMELCRRGSLAAYVADGGPLEVPTALRVLDRLADALGAAHVAGVVHCDVKPANVLLTDHGEPALGDFGIARVAVGHATTATVGGSAGGFSLDHVAPELLDDGARSPRSDVYSLGTTVWELLDGRPPFRQTADVPVGAVLTRILRRPLPESPRVPDDVLALLRRMTEKDPDERPEDMAEVRAAVAVLAAERELDLTDTPLPPLTSIQLQVIDALSATPDVAGAPPTLLRTPSSAPPTFVPTGVDPAAGPGELPTFVPPTAGHAAEPSHPGMPVRAAAVPGLPPARAGGGRGKRAPLLAASVVALLGIGGVGVGVSNAVADPEPAAVAVERTEATPAAAPAPVTTAPAAISEPAVTTTEPAPAERSTARPARKATAAARRTTVRRTQARTVAPPPAPLPAADVPPAAAPTSSSSPKASSSKASSSTASSTRTTSPTRALVPGTSPRTTTTTTTAPDSDAVAQISVNGSDDDDN